MDMGSNAAVLAGRSELLLWLYGRGPHMWDKKPYDALLTSGAPLVFAVFLDWISAGEHVISR